MLKYLLTIAAFVTLAFPAYADGYDLTHKSVDELTEDTTAAASADFLVRYDASADEFKKVGADDLNANFGVTSTAAELNILDGVTATATEINNAADISANFEDVTATNTLTTAECGKTMTLNSATEFVSTLPAPTAGCYFKFVVKAAPASASYTVVTDSSGNVIIGGINELEVDTNDDGPYDTNADTITFADGVAVVGDYVEMISDGTSWYINGQANADGGITLTTAS